MIWMQCQQAKMMNSNIYSHSVFQSLPHNRREVESEDRKVENRVLLSVVFPDGTLPEATNGGYANQMLFRKAVEKRDMSGFNAQLHSRPTGEYLADYKGLNIIKAFPLQFPFGYSGLPDDTTAEYNKTKKIRPRCYMTSLKHFLQLSHPPMHHGNFILVVHNIFARQKAFKTALIRCSDSFRNGTYGEAFAGMRSGEVAAGVAREQAGQAGTSRGVVGSFLGSIDAASADMAHTNEASKIARQNMFSLVVRYGLPAIFFTVTPDDEMCFRIRVHAEHTWVRL
jgi:hypothetical protein